MSASTLTRAATALLAGALALGLAGCGGEDSAEPAGTAAAPAATEASPAASETAGSGSGGSGGTVTNGLVCDWVASTLSKVIMQSLDPAAAKDLYVSELTRYYGDEAGSMDGAEIDGMLAETCPDVRDEAVKGAGVTSFADIV